MQNLAIFNNIRKIMAKQHQNKMVSNNCKVNVTLTKLLNYKVQVKIIIWKVNLKVN
jgi:hypothetical protein